MSEQSKHPGHPGHSAKGRGTPIVEAQESPGAHDVDLDDPTADIEAAMRDALSAVEAVEAADGHEGGTAGGSSDPPAAPAPVQDPAPAVAPEIDEEEVEALRRELADLRDRSLRTLADFDNFRKRAERERQDVRRYALLEPLREFLPVVDNLERALQAGGSAEDLKRGVELILRQMQELLRRFGVREVAADGEVFNPSVHEAVARTESERVNTPTVTETLVPGYMLHDRLLRPAMVKVAVPPSAPSSAPDAPEDRGGS